MIWFTLAEAAVPEVTVNRDESAITQMKTRMASRACGPDAVEDCYRYLLDAGWLAFGELAVDAAVGRIGTKPETMVCRTPAETSAAFAWARIAQCLKPTFGAGWAVGDAADLVWLVPLDDKRVRRIWVRAPNDVWTPPQGHYELRLVHRDDVQDPALARALRHVPPDRFAQGSESFDAIEPFVWPRVGPGRRDVLVWSRRLLGEALVVCDDRIATFDENALRGVELTTETLTGGLMPRYRYALPCRAQLVLGGIAEVTPGPRVRQTVSPFALQRVPQPPGMREGCTVTTERGRLFENSRGCELPFVGDLNRDGVADAVIYTFGEIGCDGRLLYLSRPDGTWERVASTANPC